MEKLVKKVPPVVITVGLVLIVLVAVFKFNLFGSQKLVTPKA
jgi:hypothetical protein